LSANWFLLFLQKGKKRGPFQRAINPGEFWSRQYSTETWQCFLRASSRHWYLCVESKKKLEVTMRLPCQQAEMSWAFPDQHKPVKKGYKPQCHSQKQVRLIHCH
jgi:hypothetical protein